jgi:hypothetical protein
VLVLTAHDRDGYLADMVEAGAAGFVVKEEAPETIVEAVHRAARGEVLFSGKQMMIPSPPAISTPARWTRSAGKAISTYILFAVATGADMSTYRGLAAAFHQSHPDTWVEVVPAPLGLAELAEASDCFGAGNIVHFRTATVL